MTDETTTESQHSSAIKNMTPYAPIRFENISDSRSEDDLPPVGRRRIPDHAESPSDAAAEIPHERHNHILCVGLPRAGKTSITASLGENLHREHGYKFISVFDDGRMETPSLAVPNGDYSESPRLSKFDQDPRALDTEVFVPAVSGLPDRLPANFTPFTLGIDQLTPEILFTLVEGDDANGVRATVRRILSETGSEIETPENLCDRFEGVLETSSLRKLQGLCSEGFLTPPGTETNISMASVIRDTDRVATLCCRLGTIHASIAPRMMDLWLRLIYDACDRDRRLPRVALSLGELRKTAPARLEDVHRQTAVKSLRKTIFELSTKGGSRNILLLAETSRLSHVYKPVRSNMPTKILLRLGEGDIDTLDRTYNFSSTQRERLAQFDVGVGMLIGGGDVVSPIEWRPVTSGLIHGDEHWLDQYGQAHGARVRTHAADGWPPTTDDWWVHVPDGDVRPADDPPAIGKRYSEWYLMASDFPEDTVPEDVDSDAIREALERRRSVDIPSDLSLHETGAKPHRRRERDTP